MSADRFGARAPDIDAQIRELKRELAQRANVYPRLIDGGRLTAKKAAQQVRDMEAALATLEALKPLVENAAALPASVLAGLRPDDFRRAGDGLVA